MNIETLNGQNILIESHQSTFFVLQNSHYKMRFDFLNKREFHLQRDTHAELKYFENHPLLFDYSENIVTSYINSKPENPDLFIADLKDSINEITLGWRDWKNYITEDSFFTFETFLKNILEGSGKLLKAPFSVTQNVLGVCEKHNVSVSAFDNDLHIEKYRLVTIGNNYVIAKEFKYHP